jgi:uncharacterized protein YjcR
MARCNVQCQAYKEAAMPHPQEQRRQQAVARYLAGDKIEDICREMRCAKSWLFKWKARYQADDPSWAQEQLRRPRSNPSKTAQAVEQAVVALHRTLVQSGKGGRAASVRQALKQQGTEPVPSLRTIYRILQRHEKG